MSLQRGICLYCMFCAVWVLFCAIVFAPIGGHAVAIASMIGSGFGWWLTMLPAIQSLQAKRIKQ